MPSDVRADLATLTLASFSGNVGTRFRLLQDGAEPVELELIVAQRLGPARPGPAAKREPFSLVFRAPDPRFYVPQQIHSLQHFQLGLLELFIVPIGPDAVGMRFEAIFT